MWFWIIGSVPVQNSTINQWILQILIPTRGTVKSTHRRFPLCIFRKSQRPRVPTLTQHTLDKTKQVSLLYYKLKYYEIWMYQSLPVQNIIKTAFKAPAWPTIHPDLKKTITPNIFIRQEVNTPSQVPNNTGWDMKKLDFHQGSAFWNI